MFGAMDIAVGAKGSGEGVGAYGVFEDDSLIVPLAGSFRLDAVVASRPPLVAFYTPLAARYNLVPDVRSMYIKADEEQTRSWTIPMGGKGRKMGVELTQTTCLSPLLIVGGSRVRLPLGAGVVVAIAIRATGKAPTCFGLRVSRMVWRYRPFHGFKLVCLITR
jgi:hypothetical protein